jgi:cytochrome c-type biogenesis protein CcmF
MEVFRDGKQIDTMYPEQRFYKASGQPATMVANRSTMMEDLYLVYTGKNPENGHPIIKAHLNPLVWWIWSGAHFILVGTLLALIPNAQARKQAAAQAARTAARQPVAAGAD